MAKRPLKEVDHQVLRALRWAWWAQYEASSRNGNNPHPGTISIDNHRVLAYMRQVWPETWLYGDDQKIGYRLRKLAEYGYAKREGYRYSTYTPTALGDPSIGQKVQAYEAEQKRQQQEERDTLNWFKTTMDKLVPGAEIQVSRGYTRGFTGMAITLTGPAASFRMLYKLAQMQVEQQDREAVEW